MKQGLIIFVRKPEPGKVKTRLAATIGDEKTLLIYKELLQHTFEIANAIDADKFVFYHEEIEGNDLWTAERFFKFVQINKDLGKKMNHAFTSLFEQGYEKAIIIGSDCYELNATIVNEAFESLNDNDVVIGPAKDGGYYLLGMKKMYSFIFENKEWSTPTVFNDTMADFRKQQLSFYVLPVLTDVDTEKDWLATKKSIA